MVKKISQLFDYGDELVDTYAAPPRFDPEKIKEMTMEKIHTQTRQSLVRRRPHRLWAVALAACLALSIAAVAAGYGFTMHRRAAEETEKFLVPTGDDYTGNYWDSETQEIEYGVDYWKDCKLVLAFEGADTCSAVHFKPGWLPTFSPNEYFSRMDADGWFTRLTCEGADVDGVPYRVEVYYAAQFVDGGHLLLNVYEPEEIIDETWGDYQITKFAATWSDDSSPYSIDKNYYIMYQPEAGYILIVSGDSDMQTLERIGQSLEIEATGESISAADYHNYNTFFDCVPG